MIIVGHRGARGLAPENTLASINAALAHHVDEIEFDIRVTKDGVPMLYHDNTLHDEHGGGLINQQTFQQIQAKFPTATTLDATIAHVNRRVPLLIEIKPGEPTAPVITLINAYLSKGWQSSDFFFVSFSFDILKAMHAAIPDITCIINEGWSSVRAVRRMKHLSSNRLSMNQLWLWSGFISAMHRRGYQLGTYTLNDTRKAARWQRANLYAVITDYPDRFEK